MPQPIDIDNWHRRHHFEFFKDYEIPFFSLCAEVDVTRLYIWSRQEGGPSFFLASFYLSLQAANEIESFRYRIREDSVILHETVDGGTTVMREDETFGFAYFDFDPSYIKFEVEGREILDRARSASGPLLDRPDRDDLIYYSIIPWVHFTSFSHARRLATGDSIPKIVFGKHSDHAGRRLMPVSVEVHHALMDGLDVGRFFGRFQELLDDPQTLET
jgi:chloramphenicol O-acetyltransferase type A